MSDNVQDDATDAPVPTPAADEAPAADAAPVSVPVSNKRWYVVHAYSGMEKACSVH
jgi:transcriptional antiterminator NusG